MKEAAFIARNKEKWRSIETNPNPDADHLAADFVELSDDLAYARTFYPGSDVEIYLNRLLSGSLCHINEKRQAGRQPWWNFWRYAYPELIAEQGRVFIFAFCFFLFSAFLGAFSAAQDETFVRLILGDSYVNMTLENIAAGKPMGVYAQGSEWDMFLRITTNNIRVSFIAFAFGLFFSAGTLWILFSNGVMLGAFQYFFFRHGLLLHSSMSVWAHGTFEITAIIIAGGAGLIMGNSFLFPGTYPRLESFRQGALKGIKVVTGLIPFFIIAGAIESYITRYADSNPVIGGITILLSLAGVVGYFVIYPLNIKKKDV